MDEELICPACLQLFSKPILLPCGHSLCLQCALHLQECPTAASSTASTVSRPSHDQEESDTSTGSDVDKLSVISETDSGVVCGGSGSVHILQSSSLMPNTTFPSIASTGRPSSMSLKHVTFNCGANTTNRNTAATVVNSTMTTTSSDSSLVLNCLKCAMVVHLDERGALGLPHFKLMQRLVDGFISARSSCTLPPPTEYSGESITTSTSSSEHHHADTTANNQPSLRLVSTSFSSRSTENISKHNDFYSPLKQIGGEQQNDQLHRLLESSAGNKNNNKDFLERINEPSTCGEHESEVLVNFCIQCRTPVCNACVKEGSHRSHELHALSAVTKRHKSELSANLQCLAEKVKKATELIHRLKTMSDEVNDNCKNLESSLSQQCLLIREAVQKRQEFLVNYIHARRDEKIRLLKLQVSNATARLQKTNCLLMFCIEALKERDDTTFLQAADHLTRRIWSCDLMWGRDLLTQHSEGHSMNLVFDTAPLRQIIDDMHFIETIPGHNGSDQKPAVPGTPVFCKESCRAENNEIFLSWKPHTTSHHDGFIVQLDDGEGFKDVYLGRGTSCCLSGLHFSSNYRCRVRGYNSSGEGSFSDLITIRTAPVAHFVFDSSGAHPDARITKNGTVATSNGLESRVLLGSVGLSKGVHYWQFLVNHYEGNADPAFGMARAGVNRDVMLGKDNKGWSMYIDDKRSWLMHHDLHSGRVEGGFKINDTIGVHLDFSTQKLTFYVNNKIQGRIDFNGLTGIFYPAVSLNRNVIITLQTGQCLPKASQ